MVRALRIALALLAALVALPAAAAFVVPNSVKETTTVSSTTSPMTLAGAATGYVDFDDQLSNGDTTWYTLYDAAGNIEIGIGTFTSSGTPGADTLTRGSILWSTNGNALVSFPGGTKDVIAALPGAAVSPFVNATTGVLDLYTQGQLNTSDGSAPNTGSNRMSWDNLRDVPSGFADNVDNDAGGLTAGRRKWLGGASPAQDTNTCGTIAEPCYSPKQAIANIDDATAGVTEIYLSPGTTTVLPTCTNDPQYDHDSTGGPSCDPTATSGATSCDFGTCSSGACTNNSHVACSTNSQCQGDCSARIYFARQCSNGYNDGALCYGSCSTHTTFPCYRDADCPGSETCTSTQPSGFTQCKEDSGNADGTTVSCKSRSNIIVTGDGEWSSLLVVDPTSDDQTHPSFDVSNTAGSGMKNLNLYVTSGSVIPSDGTGYGASCGFGSLGGANGTGMFRAAVTMGGDSERFDFANPWCMKGYGNVTNEDWGGSFVWNYPTADSDAAGYYAETSASNVLVGICSNGTTKCSVNGDCTGGTDGVCRKFGGSDFTGLTGCMSGICANDGTLCSPLVSSPCSGGAACYPARCSSADLFWGGSAIQTAGPGYAVSSVPGACTAIASGGDADCGNAFNLRLYGGPMQNVGDDATDTKCSNASSTTYPMDYVTCALADNYCDNGTTACCATTGACSNETDADTACAGASVCRHRPGTCTSGGNPRCQNTADCTALGAGTCTLPAGGSCMSVYAGSAGSYCDDADDSNEDMLITCRDETTTACQNDLRAFFVAFTPSPGLVHEKSIRVKDGSDLKIASVYYDVSSKDVEANSTIASSYEIASEQPSLVLSNLAADPASLVSGMWWYRSDLEQLRGRFGSTTRTMFSVPTTISPATGHIPYFTTDWNTGTIASVIETYAGLTNLSDVALSGFATGHVIRYDSGAWGNATMGSAVNTAVAASGFTDAQVEALLRNSTTGTDNAINICDLKGHSCTATGNGAIFGKYSGAWDTRQIALFTEDATNGVGLADLNNVGGLTGTDRFLFANASADGGPWSGINGATLGGDGIDWDATNNEFDTALSDATGLDVATGGYTLDLTEVSSALLASGSSVLGINTSDAGDTGQLALASSSINGATRGANIQLFGNEFSTLNLYGDLVITAGDGDAGSNKGDITAVVDGTSDSSGFHFIASEKFEFSGDAPAVSGCGTSPSIVGTNMSGVVTTGTGSPTECILTFDDGAWTNIPQCFFNSRVTTYGVVYAKTITTTAVTMDWETGTPAGVAFDYHCIGRY